MYMHYILICICTCICSCILCVCLHTHIPIIIHVHIHPEGETTNMFDVFAHWLKFCSAPWLCFCWLPSWKTSLGGGAVVVYSAQPSLKGEAEIAEACFSMSPRYIQNGNIKEAQLTKIPIWEPHRCSQMVFWITWAFFGAAILYNLVTHSRQMPISFWLHLFRRDAVLALLDRLFGWTLIMLVPARIPLAFSLSLTGADQELSHGAMATDPNPFLDSCTPIPDKYHGLCNW